MIVDELKQAVLDYAIHGKLTSDNIAYNFSKIVDPVLYQENDKKFNLKSSENEQPFKIPNNWQWIKLGKLVNYQNGYSYKPVQTSKSKIGYPIIKSQNLMSLNVVIDNNTSYINNPSKEMLKSEIKAGDLLMCLSSKSSNSEPLGKTAIYNLNCPALLNQRVLKLTPFNDVYTKYLFYVINSHYFHYNVSHKGSGSAQSNLKLNHVMEMYIPLPSVEEQQKIVRIIEGLYCKLDEIKPIEQELCSLKSQFPEDMKNSIINSAVRGKLTLQNENESTKNIIELIEKHEKITPVEKKPFEIPKNWTWIKFGELTSFDLGKTPQRADSSYWQDGKYNWISISDMVENGIVYHTKELVSEKAYNQLFKGKISKKGTLIMSFKLTVGRCSILGIDSFHNEGIISIYPKYNSEILKKYLFQVLPYMVKFGDVKGAIKGNTLNSKSLNNLLIPLPPIEEQQRIIDKLDCLLPLCIDIKKIVAE